MEVDVRNRRHMLGIPVLIAAAVLVACTTLKVNYDYDREADFTRYETYSWIESDVSAADDNPLIHQRLIRAVDAQLAAKGLRLVDSDPDLHVTYHGESENVVVLDSVGYYDGWYRYGGIGVSTTRARTYEQGTLVVDLVDVGSNRLVWRGIATDTVASSPDAQSRQIETATQQMFRRYPPSE
jgi:hypothetical protein